MGDRQKTFKWRGMTTFALTLSFIVDTVSGIVLYIAPPGRIAHWTNWTVWWLDREDWVAIHTIFGYLLLIVAAIHFYYNWKIFLNYIWSKMRKVLNLRWELAAALLINIVVFAGILWNIPPFSTTMTLGERIKEGWEDSKIQPPIPHLEAMTLQQASTQLNLPLDQMMNNLKTRGYNVKSGDQIIKDIAEEKGVSPAVLYEDMTSEGQKPVIPETIEGTGLGKKTLEAICSERGISLDSVISRLKVEGIEAKKGDKLKDIAGRYNKKPLDILNIIEGKE